MTTYYKERLQKGGGTHMRTVNKVILIGNVTWIDELKHSEGKKAVCSFGLATNRNTVTESGEKQEEADFHRLVAFGKLGELCSEYLRKGRKVYIEGRLQSRQWTDNEGTPKAITEIVLDDMVLLDSKLPDQKSDRPNHQQKEQVATP
jgi:single-strand DNA-binding protein